MKISKNQTNLINFIDSHIKEKNLLPSVREMMGGIGVTNTKSLYRAIKSLRKRGLLRWIGGAVGNVIPTIDGLRQTGVVGGDEVWNYDFLGVQVDTTWQELDTSGTTGNRFLKKPE